MCCGGPNEIGFDIAQLKTGDQIIILAGEGDPVVERDKIDIVWKKSGFSALTAGGIEISCWTISKVVRTGHHFEDYLVSAEAKAIWREIQDNLPDDIVLSEPE